MATSTATMTPNLNKTGDEVGNQIRDRVLGAIWSVLRKTNRPVTVSELRERVGANDGELDRVLAHLDRESLIALDRGMDETVVKITAPQSVETILPCWLKDRVLGALTTLARGPSRVAFLHELRARLIDLPQLELERALFALALAGHVELGQALEGSYVRLLTPAFGPMSYGMHSYAMPGYGMPSFGTPGYVMPGFRVMVERVAQAIWETTGRVPGRDLENWVEAERFVRRMHGSL